MNKFACGKSVLSKRKRGFTLSEVMIVLVIIGVITGILLPTAIQSTPDENIMKFKKGYSTLGMVIRELVTSDKYYKDGDLGIRADGNKLKSTNIGDVNYFCYTFADALNIKEINCNVTNTTMNKSLLILNADEESTDATEFYNWLITNSKKGGALRTGVTDTVLPGDDPGYGYLVEYVEGEDVTFQYEKTEEIEKIIIGKNE